MSCCCVSIILFPIMCFSTPSGAESNPSISGIENGLIEFKSVSAVFQPEKSQLENPKKLLDRMLFYHTPGVSMAVIRNAELEWAKGYGTMDTNTGAAVTTDTVFEAASTSKCITAVLALHFVQQGLLDLDANVNDDLKSWQVPENEFTVKEKVTLRRLLTHQAGLPETNFDHDEALGYPTLLDVLNGTPPALNHGAIPEKVPGSGWQYSNVGYDVIQLLLEDKVGKPFQQIAQDVIFGPLDMQQSTFVYPLDADKQKREAMPHDAEGISRKPRMHQTALAHGNLTTTPTDLAKFTVEILRSYAGKSNKVLSHEMTRQLLTQECTLDPNLFGVAMSEGLGVFLMGQDEDFLFAHPGSNLPGLNCWLIGWPERGTGAVIMTNGAKGEILAMEIISAVHVASN